MVEFYLNGAIEKVSSLKPDMTILDWLRECKGLRGTKEGCASGDCGACTVLIGKPVGDTLEYECINSCIAFAGSLHGRHLVTVEGLATGQSLHPVQQALVDQHGSQCGFCTPGIAMSLFGWALNGGDERGVKAALSGNLCRCTGYRPILAAAKQIASHKGDHQMDWLQAPQIIGHLQDLGKRRSPVEGNGYAKPRNLAALGAQLGEWPDAELVAGATDLGLKKTQDLASLPRLVDLSEVEELGHVVVTEDYIELGAAVTYAKMQPTLNTYFPEFSGLLERLGSAQIRHQGTLGGNLGTASPIGDTLPVLLALDAELILWSVSGERRLSAGAYFTGYRRTALKDGECIRCIRLPLMRSNQYCKISKVSKRWEDDISSVLGAFCFSLEKGKLRNVRMAYGGMAPIPAMADGVAAQMEGRSAAELDWGQLEQVLAQDFQPLTDVRASSKYRMKLAINLIRRAIMEVTQPEVATRIFDHA